MEVYNLKDEVKVFCTTAKSFPNGIQEAFITLDKMLSREGRTFYGISYENAAGEIIYKAAVSESFEGEAKELGFEEFTITKGEYLTQPIFDWRKRIDEIGTTFKKLLAEPLIEKTCPCIEWYKTDDEMLCMIKVDLRKKLQEQFELVMNEFVDLLSSPTEQELNKRPHEGSWTAAQVAQYIIKSAPGFAQMLNGPVVETKRDADEKVMTIKSVFLDLDARYTSPEMVKPEDVYYKKEELLFSLKDLVQVIVKAIQSQSLSKTCTAFEVPVLGFLTRLEVIYFVTYHTQRHVHQLKNIVDMVTANLESKQTV